MAHIGRLEEFTLIARERPGTSEVLQNIFLQCGVTTAVLVEYRQGSKIAVTAYLQPGPKARSLRRKLTALRLRNVRVVIQGLEPATWRDKWKEDIPPFPLGKRFMIVPVWHRKKVPATRREKVYIDTAMAFGTGLHETTRFMAQLIERQDGAMNSFLDVGTGTGLLLILASRCGARELSAIDIEAGSVAVAKTNCQLNQVPQAKIRRMDFERFVSRRQFDFVAANLVTDDLIRFKRKLVGLTARGGSLAVSGILLANLARLRKEFQMSGLRCRKIIRGRKWVAVLFQRRKNDA